MDDKTGEPKKEKNKSGPKEGMLTVSQYKDRMWRRLYRTFDYASIAFSMLVIYGSIIAAEHLLLMLVHYFLHDEIAKSPSLETLFNGMKKGFAFLAIILAAIHGTRAAIDQYRLDEKLAREDEKPHV